MMVKFKKTLFCCKELPKTSNGQDIFNVLSSYLETHCAGICPDGAPSEVLPLVKKENPDITIHCFIHREVLVSKTFGDDMKKVFNNATNMVNLSKTSSLQNV
jgi:hypothetical protein